MMRAMKAKQITILIDAGHGVNTAGKRSPEINGSRLYEYVFNRHLASAIFDEAFARGINAHIVVPELDDVELSIRAYRVNQYIKTSKCERCVLFSIHGNAAGNGSSWCKARGWEAWTTRSKNNSDRLATLLYKEVERLLPEVRLRTDMSDGDQDKEKDFTIIKMANCPAVLTENLFYDNLEDLELMMDEGVVERLAKAHVNAALRFFNV